MENSKKYKWYKIAEDVGELDFGSNNLMQINVAGKTVCMARGEHRLFACSSKCPHASGIIAEGFIDAHDNVVCPQHRYKFNLSNGRNVSGEGYFLKTYPVEERDDGVYVGIEVSIF
ncbi:MAG: Rieske 2Fe-2S domain-containing protein [Ginsengibacter sp.]